jgi:hypothetical protein
MFNRRNALSRSSPLIAVLGLAEATPALAVTLDVLDISTQPTSELLLLGSLVLLSAALAMRIYRRRHADDSQPEGPDLRWWRKQPLAIQP